MAFGRIFDILGAIVAVAMATVIVGNPHSADTIKAFGSAFSGSLKAAMGN
jgi:hypothetical protein